MAGTMFDGWPPQVAQAFITLLLSVLGALVVIVGAFGLWTRSVLKSNAKRQEAEANRQAIELAQYKAANEFVLDQAKRLTERADKQDERIVQLLEGKASDSTKIQMLSDQLQESRQHSRERDVKLGELQAKHDQAVEERKAFEERVKEEIESRKILQDRVKELEARQNERHDANEKMQLRINEIERERDTALADLRAANKRIAEFQNDIRERDDRIKTLDSEIARLKAEADKLIAPVTSASVTESKDGGL
jgi:chromosome segregation ATPase